MLKSNIDPALIARAKTAFAICVAGEIFRQAGLREMADTILLNKKIAAGELSDEEVTAFIKNALDQKALRVRIAADALDKTKPDARIFERYADKPEGQTDAEFLLDNLANVALLEPAQWPPRKVPPSEWKEYRKVMRGLEAYLQKAFTKKALSAGDQADVREALRFAAPQLVQMTDTAAGQLLWASR